MGKVLLENNISSDSFISLQCLVFFCGLSVWFSSRVSQIIFFNLHYALESVSEISFDDIYLSINYFVLLSFERTGLLELSQKFYFILFALYSDSRSASLDLANPAANEHKQSL